ncbi:hypothetical protein [Trichodesmium erythraeum]|nr:hypothetical protein [Trichodesmium erythraeum GBRTRLIN201]
MYESSDRSVIFHPLDIRNLSRKLITNNSKGDRLETYFVEQKVMHIGK